MPEENTLSAAAEYSVDFAREKLIGKKVLVLTGAGLSTDSGIPDYRGVGKIPKHPMTFDVFMGSHEARVRYWARSFVGWSRIANASPNAGHRAIAEAEKNQRIIHVVTQNVDQLHQKAGSQKVIDLHGRLDRVRCMNCNEEISRYELDEKFSELNPKIQRNGDFEFTPDGDAEINDVLDFKIVACQICQGILKPDVVFFGETVPAYRVDLVMKKLDEAEVLLIAGSSLTVNSGFRFARQASRTGTPIIIVNIGKTKADEFATAKIEANTSAVLERLLND